MEIKGKIVVILFSLLIIMLSILAMDVHHGKKTETEIKLIASPSNFTIEEGKSISINLIALKNGFPLECKVEWSVKSNGSTGKIISPFPSETNKNGYLKVKYFAPDDINELNHKVEIIAKVDFNGEEFCKTIYGYIYPKLYNTSISISSDRSNIIAGETCHLKAILLYFDKKWLPLPNEKIKWEFHIGSRTIEKESKTNLFGITKIPFFYSNAASNVTADIEAIYEINLSGKMDFNGCKSKGIKINIRPEKPGDFPVVLIHGWTGSISDSIINFTWWNLTKKLQQHGFKILDFDPIKPGIQWLTYDPGWENHHIPWIAAKVSQRIRKALVLNGYPPNQTIDIVAHSMGGLVARFMAEHYMGDVDYWNDSWMPGNNGMPWYGDGDGDVVIGDSQIDDLIMVGTPSHGVPPNINESVLQVINYAAFPWWVAQVPDMIYGSPFLKAMGYKGVDDVDYYAVGGDIGWIFGGVPKDFDGDGIAHYSDGLCPTESPYLEGKPLYILVGKAWPYGEEDHLSLMGINNKVHEYIIKHLID